MHLATKGRGWVKFFPTAIAYFHPRVSAQMLKKISKSKVIVCTLATLGNFSRQVLGENVARERQGIKENHYK